MYHLDFFNSPHQYSIFQKETNKTHCGGILFLIYIILMIFISLAYILDYALNEKYEMENYVVDSLFDFRTISEQFDLKFDQNVNQNTEFKIQINVNYDAYAEEQEYNIDEIMDNFFMVHKNIFYRGYFCDNFICPDNQGYSHIFFNITKPIYDGSEHLQFYY